MQKRGHIPRPGKGDTSSHVPKSIHRTLLLETSYLCSNLTRCNEAHKERGCFSSCEGCAILLVGEEAQSGCRNNRTGQQEETEANRASPQHPNRQGEGRAKRQEQHSSAAENPTPKCFCDESQSKTYGNGNEQYTIARDTHKIRQSQRKRNRTNQSRKQSTPTAAHPAGRLHHNQKPRQSGPQTDKGVVSTQRKGLGPLDLPNIAHEADAKNREDNRTDDTRPADGNRPQTP